VQLKAELAEVAACDCAGEVEPVKTGDRREGYRTPVTVTECERTGSAGTPLSLRITSSRLTENARPLTVNST
jgi:hypothetical protein